MSYSIVYTSRTGNTAKLAEALRDALPGVGYFGPPSQEGAQAELIFAGFWTDKGTCGSEMTEFLKGLRGKRVFLFGTAGFGEEPAYFERILAGVRAAVDPSNTVVGAYMCQGRMPAAVRARYESMLDRDPVRMKSMIENFDRAQPHPDAADLDGLIRSIGEVL